MASIGGVFPGGYLCVRDRNWNYVQAPTCTWASMRQRGLYNLAMFVSDIETNGVSFHWFDAIIPTGRPHLLGVVCHHKDNPMGCHKETVEKCPSRDHLCSLLTALHSRIMMTSSNGNNFRVTGHLCGKFKGPYKGQWSGALMFSLICVWINGWVNNREAGDLRCYRAHYDVIVMNDPRCQLLKNAYRYFCLKRGVAMELL